MKLLHLQGLRGLAIISVCLFHFYPSIFPNGYLGVDQFFLLSGYLMTMMLNRSNRLTVPSIIDFLYRRLRRITPLYYLITFFTFVSLKWSEPITWETNLSSGSEALFFATNLFRPSESGGYFEKLGLAVDMFTHAWSLAVEVQFYLIFPFLFFVFTKLPSSSRDIFVIILAFASLLYYCLSDEFLSFNSVFCRMWQFLAGMVVFYMSEPPRESPEEELESFINEKIPDHSLYSLKILFFCLTSTVFLLFWNHKIDPNFARVNITLLTALIVHLGQGCSLLEHKLAVFMGEVSYSWYLVHWPIVAHMRLNKVESQSGILFGFFDSLMISIVLHFIYERYYLLWSKKTIFSVVLGLIILNGAAFYDINSQSSIHLPEMNHSFNRTAEVSLDNSTLPNSVYFYPSDNYTYGPMGYENMTNEEKIELNYFFDRNDLNQQLSYQKIARKGSTKNLYLFDVGTNLTNLTLMVIGNSVSENTIHLVLDECKHKFHNISVAATGGCEPIVRSNISEFDCTQDPFFLEGVKAIQPDVLFIIYRHIDTMKIKNGTNPFNDKHFEEAVTRIQELEKIVKKNIYIVEPWTETNTKITRWLNDHLEKGGELDDSHFVDWSQNVLVGKQRLTRIVAGCKKCRLFDFATMFYFDGKFKIYDPKHFVSFVTKGQHFSPPGLERIRPLIRDICKRA